MELEISLSIPSGSQNHNFSQMNKTVTYGKETVDVGKWITMLSIKANDKLTSYIEFGV